MLLSRWRWPWGRRHDPEKAMSFRLTIVATALLFMISPATAQVEPFPSSFRVADVPAGDATIHVRIGGKGRSEEHTSELQSLMRISYAVFCSQKKRTLKTQRNSNQRARGPVADRHIQEKHERYNQIRIQNDN